MSQSNYWKTKQKASLKTGRENDIVQTEKKRKTKKVTADFLSENVHATRQQ